MATAMLERVPREVHKLQGRLLAARDPRRLRKYLKKLSALPMTAEVLERTGVRKTVKSLRKHEHVGTLARALAAQWKSLAVSRAKHRQRHEDSEESRDAEGLGGEVVPPGWGDAWGFPRHGADPGSPSGSPGVGTTGRPQLPRPPERSPDRRHSTARREKCPRSAVPASPPWEASSHHGHLDAAGPGSGASPPLCENCYGSLAVPVDPAPAHDPAQNYRQGSHGTPSLAPGQPLRGPQGAEREASWSTHRTHSKTPLYAGSAPASLPHKTAFYRRFRQVLSNNLDAIYDVSFIPDCVLQPVLEKCPPHQLQRIETCNPGLAEKTDHFWKIHCHRDFKDQEPEGQESWRAMYLRLEDARARRLQDVTNRIRLARAQAPEARQSRLIPIGTASAPRRKENVAFGGAGQRGGGGEGERGGGGTGRQGERGDRGGGGRAGGVERTKEPATGAAAAAAAGAVGAAAAAAAAPAAAVATVLPEAMVPGAEHTTGTRSSLSSSGSHSRGGCVDPAAVQTQAPASLNPARGATFPALDSRKPATKTVAPLMAKTIRHYKKICSRR